MDIITWFALVLFILLYTRECFKNISLTDDVEARKDELAVLRQASDHIGESNEMVKLRIDLEDAKLTVTGYERSIKTANEMLMTCLTLMSSKRDNKRWAKAKIKERFGDRESPHRELTERELDSFVLSIRKAWTPDSQIDAEGNITPVTQLEKSNTVQVGNHTVVINGPIMHETVGPEC